MPRRLALISLSLLAGCADPALATDAATDAPVLADASVDGSGAVVRVTTDGRLHVQVTDAIRGEAIPCKLTVHADGRERDPQWGRDGQIGEWIDPAHHSLGIGRWVLMAEGRLDVTLPPGRYGLTVTRGNEYSAVEVPMVELGPGRGVFVTGELERVVETEGEVAGEFHVHSAPSFDSDVPIDHRVLSLAVEGVEVFASTDHDTLGDFAPAVRDLGMGRWIHWIKGDEITADGFGHFNVYPLPDGLDPATALTHDDAMVTDILGRARRAAPGAILQLNHPLWTEYPIGFWRIAGFDPATGMSRMNIAGLFDAVEVWNSHTLDENPALSIPVDGVIDAWMATLQVGRGATATGNSDTHRLAASPPGWPRTFVRVTDDAPGQVTDAMVLSGIRAGDAMLTSGPHLRATIGDARPGGLARAVDGRVTVQVTVQAPGWIPVDEIEVWANRQRVATRALDPVGREAVRRESMTFPLTLTRDAWVVVRTRARAPLGDMAGTHQRPLPSLALVNPIYVDVDGNGSWTPPGIDGGP